MGAQGDATFAFGSSLPTAFDAMLEQRRYEYGHDPYSGTLATKSSCQELHLPPRTSEQMFEKIQRAVWTMDAHEAKKHVPNRYHNLVVQAVGIADDKWGPALAIRVPRAIELSYRKAHGHTNRRGGVWWFAGMCSS